MIPHYHSTSFLLLMIMKMIAVATARDILLIGSSPYEKNLPTKSSPPWFGGLQFTCVHSCFEVRIRYLLLQNVIYLSKSTISTERQKSQPQEIVNPPNALHKDIPGMFCHINLLCNILCRVRKCAWRRRRYCWGTCRASSCSCWRCGNS